VQLTRYFLDFKEAHDECKTICPDVSISEALVPGTTLDAVTSKLTWLPEGMRGYIKVTHHGIVYEKQDIPKLLVKLLESPVPARNKMWMIFPTNALMWEPEKNTHNLLISLLYRIHANPFKNTDNASKRHAIWAEIINENSHYGFYDYAINAMPTIQECAQLMGKRGRRILDAHSQDLKGINLSLSKAITVKWNETICTKIFSSPENEELVTIKPRAITNMDPIYHARTLQCARAIADVFHNIWDGTRTYKIGEYFVRIYFCSGYTAELLSDIMNDHVQTGVMTLLVSGDDSALLTGMYANKLGCLALECDQSAYDHSQDVGPLTNALRVWMPKLGAPSHVVDMIVEQCSKPYKIKIKNEILIEGRTETQMPTGLSMTTTINSHNTISYLCKMLREDITPEEMAAKVGFTVKTRRLHNLTHVTFLKGWWQLVEAVNTRTQRDVGSPFRWVPLPSAMIKLGKILKDPEVITKRKGYEAIQICANAIASSYGQLDETYPLLGPFLVKMRGSLRLDSLPQMDDLVESWDYKPHAKINGLDRESLLSAIEFRYNLKPDDVDRVESLIRGAGRLPVYIADRAMLVLRDVDYA